MNEVKYRIKYKIAFKYPNSDDDYTETFCKYYDDIEVAMSFYWQLEGTKDMIREDKGQIVYISLDTQIKMKEYVNEER